MGAKTAAPVGTPRASVPVHGGAPAWAPPALEAAEFLSGDVLRLTLPPSCLVGKVRLSEAPAPPPLALASPEFSGEPAEGCHQGLRGAAAEFLDCHEDPGHRVGPRSLQAHSSSQVAPSKPNCASESGASSSARNRQARAASQGSAGTGEAGISRVCSQLLDVEGGRERECLNSPGSSETSVRRMTGREKVLSSCWVPWQTKRRNTSLNNHKITSHPGHCSL